jgi:hypothetical protein
MTINPFFILLTTLTMSINSLAQTNKPAEYLHVPGPVVFDNKAYNLSWTSHPNANFYKQEYLVKGDDPNNFHSMILVDVVTGNTAIKNVVAAKVAELKKMKEGNPVVNYEVIDNPKTGEYMIDFLLTANAPDGTFSIAERNVYRYKTFTDKAGHSGVLLFGVSKRSYGRDINPFFASLKSNRKDLMGKVAAVIIPEISIRN